MAVVRPPEKRRSSRAPAGFSLRFQCLDDGNEAGEYSAQTLNISKDGLLMVSAKHLRVGSNVLLKLRVPVEISGSAFSCTRTVGRIVHRQVPEDGSIRYGVALSRASQRP
jgi:c-di-GMP-binding flagellar brake protein YcgR